MELLEVSDTACAKYFTMMLERTTRTLLKSLLANSIDSWDELKAWFIANFKDTCKQSMSIVDLAACVQGENESTNHWVHRVSGILHSSDRINIDSAIIMLQGNCRFQSLKLKLGRLKRHCNDMGALMAALVKYADSDNTKDPDSDNERPEKGKKNGGAKGQHHNQGGHGNNGKRKADSDFVANANVQRRKQGCQNRDSAIRFYDFTIQTNPFDSKILLHIIYVSTILIMKILRFAILPSELRSDSRSRF